MKNIVTTVFIVGLFVAVAGVIFWQGRNLCTEKTAYAAAKEAVLSRLKSPATATFPATPKTFTSRPLGSSGCLAQVSSHLDSQNSFGALIRSSFSATVFIGKGEATVTDTTVDGVPKVYKP